jgi:uncharacterized protein (UPF0261 family)
MPADREESGMQKTVVLLGTLDTKGIEFGYVKEKIVEQGCYAVVVDAGVLGKPLLEPDITREQVAQAAGLSIESVASLGAEDKAIEVMSQGAAVIVQELHQSGRLDGILSLGGTMGTSLATAAMRALPVGVPKVMVSTVAAWDTRLYLGTKDITMIAPVTDILGLNRITKRMLATAAGAVVGMVRADPGPLPSDKPLIGVTLHGDLMPCLNVAKESLEARGYEVIVFAAVGTGGKALEEWIEQGLIDGVFDLVTHEVAAHLYSGLADAGPHRLEAAGRKGIPQVVAPGGMEMALLLNPSQGIPEHLRARTVRMHNPVMGGVRANKEEMVILGKVMAAKLNRAIGPTAVIIPRKGFAGPDKEGGDFYDPDANLAFIEALKRDLKPEIELLELDAHINDKLFAETAVTLLDALMHKI